VLNKKRKEKKASAIKYFKENLDIPVIAAYGKGAFAEEIIKKAVENGIKVVENKDFFQFDNLFKSGEKIPEEIYKIVAEILAAILETNKTEEKWQKSF
jgi:type III secretion system FlhB-like substrate exporter